MSIKNLMKMTPPALALAFSVISCNVDEFRELNVSASVVSAGFDGITVNFTADDDVESLIVGYGSQLREAADSLEFENGTLSSIFTVDSSEGSFRVQPEAGSPAVIFITPQASDGELGETLALKAVAADAQYTLNCVSLGSFVYNVGTDLGKYAGISIMAMDSAAPDEWFMSAEEIVAMYADWGMLDVVYDGSAMVELNGSPNHSHIAGVVFWNGDYTYDMKIFEFKTGSIVKDAPAASISVSVENITAESADLVFTPGAGTCGYFYTLYTADNYNSTRATGQSFGYDPDTYVRDLCSAGGSMDFKAKTDSRTMLASGTDYVLVCYPYNVNGTEGWGTSAIVKFTTK